MRNGFALHGDGATGDATNWPLSYSIVQARGRTQALELLRDHPLAPASPGGEIDDDQSVRPRPRAGVRDERHPRLATTQVEPDVVQVGGRERDIGREPDGLDHAVSLGIDADELRSAQDRRAELDRAGVEQPQPPVGIDDDALDRDQTVGRALLVEDVEIGGWVGDLVAVAQLGDGEVNRVAPARVAHEDPPVVGDGDAGRHLVWKGMHELGRPD
jgi:hypothetical protein